MGSEVEWSVRVDEPHSALGCMTYACTLVTNLGSYADAGSSISARRRYNEFVELRAALAERVSAYGGAALPPLPGKVLWASLPSIVAARAQAFEALLAAVGKDDKLRVMPLVAAFLGASPYPARAAEVLSEEAAPEEGATAAQVPAEVSSAKPLFQSAKDDPTGGERDTSGRQAALQSVLCAAAPPVGERASSKGWAGGMSAVDAAVAPLAVSGADAPLTSDVQAAAAAELHRASVEQEEQAAAQAVLSAAKAAQVAKAAAGQAAVEAAAAAQREAQAAAPVTIAREEDAPVVAQTAAQHSQPAEEEEAEEEEPAESAPAAETLATDASEPEADASQSQGGDQVEAEGGSAAAAVPSLEDPLSAPPPPKAKKPKAKKQSATQ